MEKILHKGKIVAIKISALAPGSVPITSPEESLQLVTLNHPKGKVIAPHMHIPLHRETEHLQECLVVVRGKILISLFDEEGIPFKHLEVMQGETCITLGGYHGVEFLEDSEIIEIKNGPFFDDKKNLK